MAQAGHELATTLPWVRDLPAQDHVKVDPRPALTGAQHDLDHPRG
jgi:hypothetical protein